MTFSKRKLFKICDIIEEYIHGKRFYDDIVYYIINKKPNGYNLEADNIVKFVRSKFNKESIKKILND
jgi:hypothetical protein